MENFKVREERERIKKIIEAKFKRDKTSREKIKNPKRRLTSIFDKLEDDILFLIDNPNYKRKSES